MASLSGLFNLQILADSGAPLAGGRVYTYTAGTTTHKVAYTDAAETTSHTYVSDGAGGLYIALNSRGELPAPLFLTTGAYDIAAKTSAGVTIWTRRAQGTAEASATETSIYAALAASAGSTLLGWIQAGVGAILRTVQAKLREEVSVTDFGADPTGSADSYAAFVAAATVSANKRIRIPAGNYSIASANLTSSGITCLSNSHWQGDGKGVTTITVTGSSVTKALFQADEKTNVSFSGISFVGNSQANAYANGCALRFYTNATDVNGFTVRDCTFYNFKGDYWIYVETDAAKAIGRVRVIDCDFTSAAGNARGPANIAINSAAIGIIGSLTSAAGFVRDVVVRGCVFDIDHIKTAVQIFQNVVGFRVVDNIIRNAGVTGISDDCGAYAILVYESSGHTWGGGGYVAGNKIVSPRSCGIYHANRFEGTIYEGNEITGQTDTTTATLPKGGIVLNGAVRCSVVNNQMQNCAASGVWAGEPADGAVDWRLKIDGNVISTSTQGVYLQHASTYAVTGFSVTRNQISQCTDGVYIAKTNSGTLKSGKIAGNVIRSTGGSSNGIRVVSGDATYKLGDLDIEDNRIETVADGIIASSLTTGTLSISRNMVHGDYSNYGISFVSSTNVQVCGNSFKGMTTGYCIRSTGAQGVMEGNTFNACNNRNVYNSGSEDLGRSTPTWTGAIGTFVQIVNSVEQGGAGSKYVLRGYYHDGTNWLPQRQLTGN